MLISPKITNECANSSDFPIAQSYAMWKTSRNGCRLKNYHLLIVYTGSRIHFRAFRFNLKVQNQIQEFYANASGIQNANNRLNINNFLPLFQQNFGKINYSKCVNKFCPNIWRKKRSAATEKETTTENHFLFESKRKSYDWKWIP